VGVRENEDIFLSEIWGGDKVRVETQEIDVDLDQFSCARLGAKYGLKKTLTLRKIS
jgi:hypothetical protein